MTRASGMKGYRKRVLVGLLLTVLLLTPILSDAETAGGPQVAYVYNPEPLNRLNLRAQPSLEAESLARYYTGTVVEVLGQADAFTHVRVNDLIGYMQSTYLSETRVEPQMGTWAAVSIDASDERVHLRAQVTEGAISLGLFYNGATVQLLEDAEEFYKVRMIDLEGYMQKNFVQVDGTAGKQELTALTEGLLQQNASLYSFPSVDATPMGQYYAGEKVRILQSVGTWYYVETGSEADGPLLHQRGFMQSQVMNVSNYASGAEALPYSYAVVKSPDEKVKLHLRAQSSWSSESLGTFMNNAQVVLVDTISEEGPMPLWVHVSIGGLDGFMQGEFLGRVYKTELQPLDESLIQRTETPAAPADDITTGEEGATPAAPANQPQGIVIPMTEDTPATEPATTEAMEATEEAT